MESGRTDAKRTVGVIAIKISELDFGGEPDGISAGVLLELGAILLDPWRDVTGDLFDDGAGSEIGDEEGIFLDPWGDMTGDMFDEVGDNEEGILDAMEGAIDVLAVWLGGWCVTDEATGVGALTGACDDDKVLAEDEIDLLLGGVTSGAWRNDIGECSGSGEVGVNLFGGTLLGE